MASGTSRIHFEVLSGSDFLPLRRANYHKRECSTNLPAQRLGEMDQLVWLYIKRQRGWVLKQVFVRCDHALVEFVAHFGADCAVVHHPTHKVHLQGCSPFLLREVILTVGLEELMVSTHHASHLIDQISEDLHTAHSKEVLRKDKAVGHGITKHCCHLTNLIRAA